MFPRATPRVNPPGAIRLEMSFVVEGTNGPFTESNRSVLTSMKFTDTWLRDLRLPGWYSSSRHVSLFSNIVTNHLYYFISAQTFWKVFRTILGNPILESISIVNEISLYLFQEFEIFGEDVHT